MTINSLAFGHAAVDITLPQGRVVEVLKAQSLEALSEPESALLDAFQQPIQSQPLSELLTSQDRIVIVIPDKTRSCGADIVLPVLVNYMNSFGITDEQIQLILANGAHTSHGKSEIAAIVGESIITRRLRILEHDCHDNSQLAYICDTGQETPVYINKALIEADRIIVISTVVHHYFAGFGGGPKMIVPGCAGYETIRKNHALTISESGGDIHPDCRSGNFKNPVQDDIQEAIEAIPVSLLIETVMNESVEIAAVFAGEMKDTHAKACEYIDTRYRYPIDREFDLVIASCGGFPKDINMIQSHKTLYNAFQAVRKHGIILLLAECEQGMGSDTFMEWFVYKNKTALSKALINDYRLNGTTALSVISKAQQAHIILVTHLSGKLVEQMGLIPAATVADAFKLAEERLPERYDICVIPNGSITLPEVI